jgi:hypothetical protein
MVGRDASWIATRLVPTVLAAVAGLGFAPSAFGGATFNVDSNGDRLDADPTDNVCATAAGKCTLRAAIGQANETAGNPTINVPAGTYKLKRPPAVIESNEEGDLQVDVQMAIDGAGRRRTVIVQTQRDRVIASDGGAAPFSPVTISDVRITGGRGRGQGSNGGGIINTGALLLERSAVSRNNVRGPDAAGGGVYSVGLLLVDRTIVRDNRARALDSVASGGGINAATGSLAIARSRVLANKAIAANPAFGRAGGVGVGDNATISDTTIAGNSSNGYPGGLGVNDELDLRTSTISGNTASKAGGIYSSGPAAIENTTLSGNTATEGEGSAIYRPATPEPMTLTHVTVAKNHATGANAAIGAEPAVPDESIVLRGSIVHNRGLDCGPEVGKFLTDWNVFGDNSCSPPGAITNAFANPLLRDLADNGGRTRTHALRSQSAAIGHVSAGCPPPATDQRNVARPQGSLCDAGAYERTPGS